jgi:DNA-binding PadR family transcriptional regulator
MIDGRCAVTLTPLAVSALGLLVERPLHPYEMYQLLLERGVDRLVKVRPGSLYHTVERLEDHGLVESTGTTREGNRPERTTYAITGLGREVLRSRISELITQPVREYPHFPFALSEAHNLPDVQAVADLTQYVEALDREIAEVEALLQAARDRCVEETYWIAGDYVLSVTRAQRDWIRTLITRIETKDLIWQPHKV